ncbi:hypothetical protein LguiA_013577 [Lonicera macranthoides]
MLSNSAGDNFSEGFDHSYGESIEKLNAAKTITLAEPPLTQLRSSHLWSPPIAIGHVSLSKTNPPRRQPPAHRDSRHRPLPLRLPPPPLDFLRSLHLSAPFLEESSPLLSNVDDEKKAANNKPIIPTATTASPPAAEAVKPSPPSFPAGVHYGWTADGLPMSQGSVMGETMRRSQWDSSLFACLGRNDDFCSSDLEVFVVSVSVMLESFLAADVK